MDEEESRPLDKMLMVMLGGAAGSYARYVVGLSVTQRMGARFPYGTLAANVSGCFLIGLLMTLLTQRWPAHPHWRLLLVTGFLGGYTTFSSFEWETFQAARGSAPWLGFLNVVSSVALGYFAVWCGAWLARR